MQEARLFLRDVARAPSERAIAMALIDAGEKLTGALAVGFYSMKSSGAPAEIHTRTPDDRLLDHYEREGRDIDPLVRRVVEHHLPVEVDLLALEKASPSYAKFIRSRNLMGFRQYMLAPIVVGGELVGTMNFSSRSEKRFSARVLRLAYAMSLHVSTRIAVLRALDSFAATWDGALTPREQEIGALAARGLSTADMGCAAGVSPNTVKKHLKALYAKLGIASRAELGVLLLRGPGAMADEKLSVVLPQPRPMPGGAMAFSY